jgi:hypothetical protein
MGQMHALPYRSIDVRFARNKQTLTETGLMRRYVPNASLRTARKTATFLGVRPP